MILQPRAILLVVALVATAAPPAGAQTAAPAAGPSGTATQSTTSIPDFSGIWSHPSFPGFEPPASGPGPVVNKARRPQGAGIDGRTLPPNNNILVSNPARLIGDYSNPILKPQAAEIVKKHGEMEVSGAGSPTPTIQCWPEPVPYIFNGVAMVMLQRSDRITFLYPNDHQVRHVRMNVPHPAKVAPSWYGDSVGHYEGDELVIDTVGIKHGRFSMIDWFGTPYTEALHLVERYRLLDHDATMKAVAWAAKEHSQTDNPGSGPRPDPNYRGKGLQIQLTVEDTGTFTMPWTATLTFRRALDEWSELVCAENIQWHPGTYSEAPTADKPDF